MKEFLLKRIHRIESRIDTIKKQHGDTPSKDYNYFGGWDLGYWEGMLAAYQNTLDEIEAQDTDK